MRSKVATVSLIGIAAALLSVAGAGVAFAVNGGTYSPSQQHCNYQDTDWNTPPYKTYPGCHNAQLTLESGGMTDGNPNNGYNNSKRQGDHGTLNTYWVSAGIMQSPNDEHSKGTPTLYSLGFPGQSGSPHAACIAVNTDGTGGRAPEGEKSTTVRKANSQQKYGCGNNKKGAGFSLNADYYEYYCPLAAMLPSFPYKCEGIPGGDYGKTTLTPDTGTEQNLTKLATEGFILYYGMDDNSDNGEHDGEGPYTSPLTHGSINGPSDGGGVMLALTPYRIGQSGTLSQPEGLLNAATGFCADGICLSATTQKQTVYEGCESNTGEDLKHDKCRGHDRDSERNVYDYSGKKWDPYSCNSGGEQDAAHRNKPQPDSAKNCNTSRQNASPTGTKNTHGGMDFWRQHEVHKVTNEPGFQFYEDPDPMGSPALPIYPLPAVYAGSCGVVLGGGGMAVPNSPVTNKAHQLQIKTGC
jgi:hypothetical protein